MNTLPTEPFAQTKDRIFFEKSILAFEFLYGLSMRCLISGKGSFALPERGLLRQVREWIVVTLSWFIGPNVSLGIKQVRAVQDKQRGGRAD